MRLPSLIVAITVIIALVGGVGWYVISGGIEEFYSPGWFSASTENAKYRRVFVSSPVVMPSRFALNDSVAFAVTDAWIERPTRVRYRWYLIRRETRDSTFRLVVNLAQVVRDSGSWSFSRGRSFANASLLVNGARPASTGNAAVHTIYLNSYTSLPDTVRLSVERR